MLLVDRMLGSRAAFINAWSVVERLCGRHLTGGVSLVASRYGPMVELLAVVGVNTVVGFFLAFLARLLMRTLPRLFA